MRHLEIVAVERSGFVAAEKHARRRHVVGRREGLRLGIAAGAALERHQVEELASGGSRIVAAHRVHRRELLQRAEFVGVERQLFQRLLRPGRSGIVDQDIDVAEPRDHVGDSVANRLRIRAVEHHRRDTGGIDTAARADRIGRGLDPRGGPSRHHDGRAFRDIASHDVAADIAGGPGHDRDLA